MYKKRDIPLIGGLSVIIYIPYPLSKENYQLIKNWLELMELALVEPPNNDMQPTPESGQAEQSNGAEYASDEITTGLS